MDPGPLDELEEQFRRAVGNNELPGLAYAILRDGKVVRASAFGVKDLDSREPWRFDTLCRLYSMTKSVAVVGLMALVEDGLLALNDPVSKYLPAFRQERLQIAHNEEVVKSDEQNATPTREMKIIHLLTHSSGLSYGPAMGDESSCASEESYRQLMQRVDTGEVSALGSYCDELAKLPLRYQPGERWEYSYSIDVVGRIMEVVSGKRLDEYLRERVIEPLKLNDTTFSLPEGQCGRLATFYRRRPDTNSNDSLDLVDAAASSRWSEERCSGRVLSAGGTVGTVAGGLVSTLNDFSRLCLMLQNEGELDGVRVLRSDTVRMMCTNLLPEVTGKEDSWCLETAGLGFGILGSVAVRHPDANWYDPPGEVGWGGLAGTAWAIDRRERLIVVTFCQVMYELWIDEEARKAARLALGYVPPPTEASDSDASPATITASDSDASPAKSTASEEVPHAPLAADAGLVAPEAVSVFEAAPPAEEAESSDKENVQPASPDGANMVRAPEMSTPPTSSERAAAAKRAAPEVAPSTEVARETPSGKKTRLSHDSISAGRARAALDCGAPSPLGEKTNCRGIPLLQVQAC